MSKKKLSPRFLSLAQERQPQNLGLNFTSFWTFLPHELKFNLTAGPYGTPPSTVLAMLKIFAVFARRRRKNCRFGAPQAKNLRFLRRRRKFLRPQAKFFGFTSAAGKNSFFWK